MNSKEAKKLINELLQEEIKEKGHDVEITSLTKGENLAKTILEGFKEYLESTKAILQNIKSELYLAKNASAICDVNNHKIKVFLDEIVKRKSISDEYQLWELVVTVYHEYQHLDLDEIIFRSSLKDELTLYLKIENLIKSNEDFYIKYHDCFYKEILANKYGVEKAEKFFKEKYEKTKSYKNLKTHIAIELLLHEIYFQNYDVHPFFEKANETAKELTNEFDISTLVIGSGVEIIPLLYNQDGTFKDLETLTKDETWNKLPINVKYLIVSSEVYLKEQNYKKISKENLKFIVSAIDYCLNEEYRKTKENQKIRIKLDEISKSLEATDPYGPDTYLTTILVLNRKEMINKNKIKKLIAKKEEILNYIKEKENPPKRKVLNRQQRT